MCSPFSNVASCASQAASARKLIAATYHCRLRERMPCTVLQITCSCAHSALRSSRFAFTSLTSVLYLGLRCSTVVSKGIRCFEFWAACSTLWQYQAAAMASLFANVPASTAAEQPNRQRPSHLIGVPGPGVPSALRLCLGRPKPAI